MSRHPSLSVPLAALALVITDAAAGEPLPVLPAGSTRVFTAPAGALSCEWRVDGAIAATTAGFSYTPAPKDVGPRVIESVATLPGGEIVRDKKRIRVFLEIPESRRKFHVSPGGSDANPGTPGEPFLTLEKARDTIRALPRPLPAGGVTVFLRGGTHFRTEPFLLTSADSGNAAAPLIYRAFPGERPVISGGKRQPAKAFTPLAQGERARVAPGIAAERILELDLAAAGIAHAARFPPSFHQWITRNPHGGLYDGGICELIFNGARMPLSRYPNDDPGGDEVTEPFLRMDGVAEGMAADGSGHLKGKGLYTWGNGATSEVGGAFHYRPEDAARIERWQGALDRGGAWLQGYWRVPWGFDGTRIAGIDPSKRVIQLAPNGKGDAVRWKIGDKYRRLAGDFAGSGEERYRVVNLLEEIDRPGEWCIDFSRGKLYFLPPGKVADGTVAISDNAAPLVHGDGVSHTSLVGLGFESALSGGVVFSGGTRNLVAGCTFRTMNTYAVELRGGDSHGVLSCDMEELGGGGIYLLGGDENASPRVPAGHFAVNNRITGFGRVTRVYAAAVDVGFGGAAGGGGGGGHVEAVGMLHPDGAAGRCHPVARPTSHARPDQAFVRDRRVPRPLCR